MGARRQADARGVPASLMLPRLILVVAVVFLSLIGLVMGFSASSIEAIDMGKSVYSYVFKQGVMLLVGAAAAFLIARFLPYEALRNHVVAGVLLALVVVGIAAVGLAGTEVLGGKRWIYIGSFSLQPSEFSKIVFVIVMACILSRYRARAITPRGSCIATIGLVFLPLGVLMLTQSDMGTAVVVVVGVFAVMVIGGVPARVLALFVAAVALAAVASMTGYRAERLEVWLDPWSDPYGTGLQSIRSFYAFAEGGLFGVGLGNSREKFQYLSEAENDFVFAIVGEELGMVGALAVIVLFLAVLYAGLRIARSAPDDFGCMLAGGLTVMLVGQAFLNMAVVTGLFPVTGKPLPFISSGGSSILSSLMIVGIILAVSRGSNVLTPYERRRNDLNVIRVEGASRTPRSDVRAPRAGGGDMRVPRADMQARRAVDAREAQRADRRRRAVLRAREREEKEQR